MRADQQAVANSRLLALLAHLVMDGLSLENRFLVDQIPPLGPFLPGGENTDEWDAEHYRFFGHELLPWESVFRSPDGQLAGPVAEAVSARYAEAQFTPPLGQEPDHLGVELMFLAWLWDRRDHDRAAQFAGEHLRPWLIPLACAARDAGGFYGEVVDLALQLVDSFAEAPPEPDLDIPAVLDDPKSGMKHIAHWLATPAWSGMFWTRRSLTRISSRAGVAQGFGSRRDILESTLFAASDAQSLPALTDAMKGVIDQWKSRMDSPAAASSIRKLNGTLTVIDRIGAAGQ